MSTMLERAHALFTKTYGGAPTLVARAPGRVNLIGEHTDYNDGFVLPVAINRATYVAARGRVDGVINVVAGDLGGAHNSFRADRPISADPTAPWSNYVRGVAAGLLAHGIPLAGADLAIVGDVPQGAGLSSSASLEMAVGFALTQLQGCEIAPTDLALIGQTAEHEYAGCQCGVMDQLVSAHGAAGHALLIDCRDLAIRRIAIPDDITIMIIPSGQTRGLVDGAYNMRRAQCAAAAAHHGVAALRDLEPKQLDDGKSGLDAIAFRRARHVVSENQRTLAAANCLADGNLVQLGLLMAESHNSMRDDFEITTPVIDQLVHLLQSAIGTKGGARMTGGGFGGAVVAIMQQSIASEIEKIIADRYTTPSGMPTTPMRITASQGVSVF